MGHHESFGARFSQYFVLPASSLTIHSRLAVRKLDHLK